MTDCFAHKHTFSYRDNGKLNFGLHVLHCNKPYTLYIAHPIFRVDEHFVLRI